MMIRLSILVFLATLVVIGLSQPTVESSESAETGHNVPESTASADSGERNRAATDVSEAAIGLDEKEETEKSSSNVSGTIESKRGLFIPGLIDLAKSVLFGGSDDAAGTAGAASASGTTSGAGGAHADGSNGASTAAGGTHNGASSVGGKTHGSGSNGAGTTAGGTHASGSTGTAGGGAKGGAHGASGHSSKIPTSVNKPKQPSHNTGNDEFPNDDKSSKHGKHNKPNNGNGHSNSGGNNNANDRPNGTASNKPKEKPRPPPPPPSSTKPSKIPRPKPGGSSSGNRPNRPADGDDGRNPIHNGHGNGGNNDNDNELNAREEKLEPGTCGVQAKKYPQSLFETMDRSKSTRIIGGGVAERHSWPWFTVFQKIKPRGSEFICGASLIRIGDVQASDVIVTAAHCVAHRDSKDNAVYYHREDFQVIVGIHDITDENEPGREVRSVLLFRKAPGFDPVLQHNDIALVKLNGTIKFTNRIRPICLVEHPAASRKCAAIGFGRTDPNPNIESHSPVLKQLQVEIHSHSTCKSNPFGGWGDRYFGDIMICAGHLNGTESTCKSDAGGPLQCMDEDGRWVLHGVESFGAEKTCSKPGRPPISTRMVDGL